MQKYTPLGDTATETVKQALLNHEDNINSIRSSNSGSSFPNENLVAGMKCYRTDLKAEYIYDGEDWFKITADKDVSESVTTKSLTVSGETSVPTPSTENNSQTIANTEFVHGVVNKLVNGAPSALDTLQELSAALGDDPNFSTTVLNKIGEKESKEDANIEHTALKNAMVTGVGEVAGGALKVSKGDGTSKTVNAGLNMLARNKTYAVGDIAYSPNLPSYLYLECITAGTTGNTEPDMSAIKSGGVTVSDGTVKFSVKTVCAREYVDIIKNDVGTVKQIPISSYNNIYDVSCYQCGRIVFLSFGIAQITWHNQPFSTNHLFISERTLPKPVKAMSIEAITNGHSTGIRLYFSTDGNLGPHYAGAYTSTQGNECEVQITYLTND